MTSFVYQAWDATGHRHRGTLEAKSDQEVIVFLARHGLTPTEISGLKKRETPAFPGIGRRSRVSSQDLVAFARALATLVRSGLPLPTVVNMLALSAPSPSMARLCQRLSHEIEEGASFSQALYRMGDRIPTGFGDAVKAGEEGGSLPDVLERLATLLERDHERQTKLREMLRYPIMVGAALLVGCVLVAAVVIPRVAGFYAQGGVRLPLPTLILFGAYQAAREHMPLTAGAVAGLAILGISAARQPEFRSRLEGLSWAVPVIGPIRRSAFASQFCHFFATFYEAGVSVERILQILAEASRRSAAGRTLEEIWQAVHAGQSLGNAMKAAGPFFPPILVQMASMGEESGALPSLLRSCGSYFELETESQTRRAIAYLEPAGILFFGALILFFGLATFLPMWDLMSVYR